MINYLIMSCLLQQITYAVADPEILRGGRHGFYSDVFDDDFIIIVTKVMSRRFGIFSHYELALNLVDRSSCSQCHAGFEQGWNLGITLYWRNTMEIKKGVNITTIGHKLVKPAENSGS